VSQKLAVDAYLKVAPSKRGDPKKKEKKRKGKRKKKGEK